MVTSKPSGYPASVRSFLAPSGSNFRREKSLDGANSSGAIINADGVDSPRITRDLISSMSIAL